MSAHGVTVKVCKLFCCLTLLSLLVGLPVGAIAQQTGPSAERGAPLSFADLAEEVRPAVVNIFTTRVLKKSPLHPFFGPESPLRDFFGEEFKRFFGDLPQGEMRTSSLGSGVIIDGEGLILTNNHVIEKADEINIRTEGGREYAATVVGRDPKTDLALIQVKPDADFPRPARLGDSDAAREGDWVIAVGNPFGLGHTVTSGIISAKGRVIGAGPYDDFLQTDAAINPGNSGGPLYNMNGEVVGINTAIVARAQGIGFATSINLAKQLLPQLKQGKVIRGWLGVAIQNVTPELAESFNIKAEEGVLVSDVVQGGPADQAGLRRGDVIIRFSGQEVKDAHSLSSIVAVTPPDTQLQMEILRNGTTQTLPVTIGTMPQEEGEAPVKREEEEEKGRWGMKVSNLTPELAQRFGLTGDETGVVITDTEPGSPAANADLRSGDVIVEANRKVIRNIDDFNQVVSEAQQNLLLLVRRDGGTFYVPLRQTGGQ